MIHFGKSLLLIVLVTLGFLTWRIIIDFNTHCKFNFIKISVNSLEIKSTFSGIRLKYQKGKYHLKLAKKSFSCRILCYLFNFFLSEFSIRKIHNSQDSRGRMRLFIYFLFTTSTLFTDTYTLVGRLLQRSHLCT